MVLNLIHIDYIYSNLNIISTNDCTSLFKSLIVSLDPAKENLEYHFLQDLEFLKNYFAEIVLDQHKQ